MFLIWPREAVFSIISYVKAVVLRRCSTFTNWTYNGKKAATTRMHIEYKILLPDHDFVIVSIEEVIDRLLMK